MKPVQPKVRSSLKLDLWVTKARTLLSYGSSKLYNCLIEKENSSLIVAAVDKPVGVGKINKELLRRFPYVVDPKSNIPVHEHGLSVDEPGHSSLGLGGDDLGTENKDPDRWQDDHERGLLPGPGDLLEIPPVVGDLVVVKCDLQFASTGNTYPRMFVLPESLTDRFVAVDIMNPKVRKASCECKYFPILCLNVFLEIDGMLDLTKDDYEENLSDTKIWDRKDLGGIRQKDYIRKRAWLASTFPEDILRSSGTYSQDYVEFHTLVWRENDLITGIPGIVETRREKHWFLDNWNSNIYRSFRDLKGENYVKFPLVGIVGTLMETKVVTHSLTGGGEYIGGDEFQTTFYKILFRDRIPVWVDAPVWRCPEPLSLPIYLPIP